MFGRLRALHFKVKAVRRLGWLGLIFPVDWMRYAELSYLFAVPPIFTTLEGDNPVAEYVGELAKIFNSVVLARVWEGCGKRGAVSTSAPLEEAARKLAEFLKRLEGQGEAKVAAEVIRDVTLVYTHEVQRAVEIVAEIENDEDLKDLSIRIAKLKSLL
jgi:hypothetical protein